MLQSRGEGNRGGGNPAETVAYTQPGRISPSMLSLSVTIDHRERAPMTSHPFHPSSRVSHRSMMMLFDIMRYTQNNMACFQRLERYGYFFIRCSEDCAEYSSIIVVGFFRLDRSFGKRRVEDTKRNYFLKFDSLIIG